MSTEGVEEILGSAGVEEGAINPDDYTLEQLILLINTERLHHLESKSSSVLEELSERQQIVTKLHNLLAKINEFTDDSSKLKIVEGSELEQMLKEAKELGIKLPKTSGKLSAGERERLVENIRMRIEDLNVKNDMQLQELTRLTNERYESWQLARSILKPIDEDKKQKIRAITGR